MLTVKKKQVFFVPPCQNKCIKNFSFGFCLSIRTCVGVSSKRESQFGRTKVEFYPKMDPLTFLDSLFIPEDGDGVWKNPQTPLLEMIAMGIMAACVSFPLFRILPTNSPLNHRHFLKSNGNDPIPKHCSSLWRKCRIR